MYSMSVGVLVNFSYDWFVIKQYAIRSCLNRILPQCGQNIQTKCNINYTQLLGQVDPPPPKKKFRVDAWFSSHFCQPRRQTRTSKNFKVLVKIFWVSLFTLFFYGSHFRTKAFVLEVQNRNIRTVGHLSSLDEASVNRLPVATPKISHARAVLHVSRN